MYGALGENWTRDLFLTKEVLYPWATRANSFAKNGAGGGNRTRTISLEGWGSTTKPHPHGYLVGKYGGGGRIRTFEAFATELQSVGFDRSPTPPSDTGMSFNGLLKDEAQ